MTKAWIGCSGYNYRHWRGGVFYPNGLPQKNEFRYYSTIFETVEINNTFYGLPPEKTWQNWHDRAPKNFLYAIKVNQYLTRFKKLVEVEEPWGNFWSGARLLKEHLGPILFQLPPNLSINLDRLKNLANFLPKSEKFAFEFRHMSWFVSATYQLLQRNGWALVINSHPILPTIFEITAKFTYLRFHGSQQLYRSFYSQKELEVFAFWIKKQLDQKIEVYGYFNNDEMGYAPKNAVHLRQMLK